MEENSLNTPLEDRELHEKLPISGLYENWFLEYASYVILERAVPAIEDGLKPVQRRIMHALNEMDDGRFNKVANVIGSTMQYHPHGDASINDAIVNLGQKEILFDTQGNWGDVRTGDSAAAPRYIAVAIPLSGNFRTMVASASRLLCPSSFLCCWRRALRASRSGYPPKFSRIISVSSSRLPSIF